jgi:hypothetical protein
VDFSFGCYVNGTDQSGFAETIEVARLVDVVFFFGGINLPIKNEGHDRISIDLPPIQLALLQELEKVVRSPIHVVIMSGSSLDLSYIRDSANYGSLIWMGLRRPPLFSVNTILGGSYTTLAYSWSNDTAISSYSIGTLLKDNHHETRVTIRIFRVNVTNTGLMTGDDAVLAFVTPPQLPLNGQTPPIKQLFGFERGI